MGRENGSWLNIFSFCQPLLCLRHSNDRLRNRGKCWYSRKLV